MNLPVILRPLARFEFEEAADWYEQQRTGRRAAFIAAVEQSLLAIGSRPELYAKVYGNVREALVPNFPYAIYYRQTHNQITVLAVFHTSRDPSEWQRRA